MKVTQLLVVGLLLLTLQNANAQSAESSEAGLKSFALLVHDYDETIEFYTEILGFEVTQDQTYGESMRWVSLKLPGSEIELSLGKVSEEDVAYVGKQSGNNYPLFVMAVEDVEATYNDLIAKGVNFIQEPSARPWGMGALFEDLYGNKIYLQTK